ncbi:prepilin-type N-terminal cleavage/methylation domain-containing protein [Campylobacter fetus]|uniref:prepilin-type N-terminal cleavage/methylation domain-containing protein n=1 Tax=Campylobacter fetus TaxID=196 RepID=UPI0003C26F34|nr:prepilin-type N-terminal cleavage/methylation domain-containing protein [Campylobacter fetus]AGZ81731.1 putative type II secretion system protein [Campylobacter fetus subsp. testudinum 03-427]AJB45466.1 N-terminal methylation protein [Campylobacter fetus subsp. testudinum]EAI4321291.1 prepilin-type N-terminal cleavage/methylation domain-containing protein [Campylobacter fetus]EAI4390548.1 prepilin-type N-terminal cleavage/methylation domain-containing protein [Campylobacter fetus]OCR93438.1
MKKAFTIMEIVFVIIILGILVSIAIPRFSINRKDAQIAKAQVELANIRSTIALKRSESFLVSGESSAATSNLNNILKEAKVSTTNNTSSDYLLRWSVSGKTLKLDIKNYGTATFSDNGNGKFETCTSTPKDLCENLKKYDK